MTITSTRRSRSPKSFIRKDARNVIYRAMYGAGDKRVASDHTTPAYDPKRTHANPTSIDWHNVKARLRDHWLAAAFDELTANKIVSDFNHYAKGSIKLTRAELEVQS
jgi:hypothetical protein